MERRMTLTRTSTGDEGTFGQLSGMGFNCFTAELPWRYNKSQVSCIPEGVYSVEFWSSKKYKEAYHICRVPGREAILIHQGNWAGDTLKGFKSNVLGCILVGSSIGQAYGQKAVLASKVTLSKLVKAIGKEPFKLVIRRDYAS